MWWWDSLQSHSERGRCGLGPVLLTVVTVAALWSAAGIMHAQDTQNVEEHPETHNYGHCDMCHPIEDERRLEDSCLICHPDQMGDHPIGVPAVFVVADSLPLSEDGLITCVTCHNPHTPRWDTRSWRSRSPVERVVDWVHGPERYPTYFLRRNNDDGSLCLICHLPGDL